jgi:hypothetical protein
MISHQNFFPLMFFLLVWKFKQDLTIYFLVFYTRCTIYFLEVFRIVHGGTQVFLRLLKNLIQTKRN